VSAAPGGAKSSTRRYVIAGLIAFVFIVGAAFGVGALIAKGHSTTTTTPRGFPGGSSPAFQAFQSCLSKHGVSLPSTPPAGAGGSPGAGAPPSGGGFSSATRKAFAACASHLPSGGPSGGAGFPGG